MSSILNMLNFGGDNNLNLVTIVPVFALVVAVAFLLKFSLRKSEVSKKTQKKAQKVHATNKRKDEKKASSSPTKFLDRQTSNEAAKPKSSTKQQQQKQGAVIEKPYKKNSSQNKKQQVNNTNTNNVSAKNNQQVNKKEVNICVNKEEEGEWQIVTTKKQRQNKQEENVEIETTPVKTTKKCHEKDYNKWTNKTKMAKEVTEKSDKSTKVVNRNITTVGEIRALNSEPKKIINKSSNNSILPSEITKVTNKNENVDSDLSSTNAVLPTNIEVKILTAHEAASVANVAFDELGNDGWTDTKPQKKNRRKALRE